MRDIARRLAALEVRRRSSHLQSSAPVYTVIGENDPLPAVRGPVYRMVTV